MSASLVGSEMCIRDSPAALPRNYRAGRHQIPGSQPSSIPGALPVTLALSLIHILTLPTICSV
eukprot:9421765-Alexandrium_andersonii.AAC.1